MNNEDELEEFPLAVSIAGLLWIFFGVSVTLVALLFAFPLLTVGSPEPLRVFLVWIYVLSSGISIWYCGHEAWVRRFQSVRSAALFSIVISFGFHVWSCYLLLNLDKHILTLIASGLGCCLTAAGFLALCGARSYENWKKSDWEMLLFSLRERARMKELESESKHE